VCPLKDSRGRGERDEKNGIAPREVWVAGDGKLSKTVKGDDRGSHDSGRGGMRLFKKGFQAGQSGEKPSGYYIGTLKVLAACPGGELGS